MIICGIMLGIAGKGKDFNMEILAAFLAACLIGVIAFVVGLIIGRNIF